jgi:hypothetical protein
MPGIDDLRLNLLHEVMSRPNRLLFPVACAALSLGFSACVGTIYDRMYSNKKTYFKAPAEKKEASASELLGDVDKNKTPAPEGLMPEAAPGLAPPPGGDIPGLPPAMPAEPGAAAPPPALPPPPP